MAGFPPVRLRAAAFAEDARMRFEARYERQPSWDVPRPQPAFVDLAEQGLIRGIVLDAGCGTGENALWLAARGLAVWGVDIALPAIGLARAKAAERGLPVARFLVGDALQLEALGLTFDTIIDSGLFHALSDPERALYVASLARAIAPRGLCHVLCFSDAQPGQDGPRRVSRSELCTAFRSGWRRLRIAQTRFLTCIHRGGAHAWIASFRREGGAATADAPSCGHASQGE
jgi:SAM-dependent methyltransferase